MTKAMHRRFGRLFGGSVVALLVLSPQIASAAACLSGSSAMGQEAIAGFKAEPSTLLSRNPLGGQALANEVRSLVASDVESADAVIALAASAPPQVQGAIGRGLAAAAKACVVAFPELAAALQEKVAASGMTQMQASFAAASEDVATAALEEPAPALPADAGVLGEGAPAIGSDGALGGTGGETGSTTGGGEVALSASGPIANPAASSGGLGDGTSFLSGLADTGSSETDDADDDSSDAAPLSPTR
jgi:hypothetical protein